MVDNVTQMEYYRADLEIESNYFFSEYKSLEYASNSLLGFSNWIQFLFWIKGISNNNLVNLKKLLSRSYNINCYIMSLPFCLVHGFKAVCQTFVSVWIIWSSLNLKPCLDQIQWVHNGNFHKTYNSANQTQIKFGYIHLLCN